MDPFIHIGKIAGFKSKIIWAQDPTFVELACKDRRDFNIIYDEYHEEFTGGEFLMLIKDLEYELMIGQRFG
jgi:hypothetical protein